MGFSDSNCLFRVPSWDLGLSIGKTGKGCERCIIKQSWSWYSLPDHCLSSSPSRWFNVWLISSSQTWPKVWGQSGSHKTWSTGHNYKQNINRCLFSFGEGSVLPARHCRGAERGGSITPLSQKWWIRLVSEIPGHSGGKGQGDSSSLYLYPWQAMGHLRQA